VHLQPQRSNRLLVEALSRHFQDRLPEKIEEVKKPLLAELNQLTQNLEVSQKDLKAKEAILNQSTTQLIEYMAHTKGLMYMRTTRAKTPVIYGPDEVFTVGGSKVHGATDGAKDAVLIAAGITLHEALKAQKELISKGKKVTVVDLYSVKPVDEKTVNTVCKDSKKVMVIEDHYAEGGIAEAVRSVVKNSDSEFISLAVRKMPCSGKPAELLAYEEIDAAAIVRAVETT
jgi:transketolase